MCRERDSNPHGHSWPRDFKSLVSTNSTIAASSGAENGTRTRDPNLGKVVLYQLSYFRIALIVIRDCKVTQIFRLSKFFLKNFHHRCNILFYLN